MAKLVACSIVLEDVVHAERGAAEGDRTHRVVNLMVLIAITERSSPTLMVLIVSERSSKPEMVMASET
jgi:hypothetical protein